MNLESNCKSGLPGGIILTDRCLHNFEIDGVINTILIKYSNMLPYIEEYMRLKKVEMDTHLLRLFCENPMAMHIVNKYKYLLNESCLRLLCANPGALDILTKFVHKFDEKCWMQLCKNTNLAVFRTVLAGNLDRICPQCFAILLKNTASAPFIKEHINYFLIRMTGKTSEHYRRINLLVQINRLYCKYGMHDIPFFDGVPFTDILCANIDSLTDQDWEMLADTPNTIDFVYDNIDKVINKYWFINVISGNPNVYKILSEYNDSNNIPRFLLAEIVKKNPNPDLLRKLEKSIRMFDRGSFWPLKSAEFWFSVCENPGAIDFIISKQDVWSSLTSRYQYFSQPHLNNCPHFKKDECYKNSPWYHLCKNPHAKASRLISEHIEKFDGPFGYYILSQSEYTVHHLISLDYVEMRENMSQMRQELVAYFYNPDRMIRIWNRQSNISFLNFLNFYYNIFN